MVKGSDMSNLKSGHQRVRVRDRSRAWVCGLTELELLQVVMSFFPCREVPWASGSSLPFLVLSIPVLNQAGMLQAAPFR